MGYVYYCVFCGFHTQTDVGQSTGAQCTTCGGALRVCPSEEYPAIAAALDAGRDAHRPALDGAAPLVVLLTVAWLAGLVSEPVRDVLVVGVGAVFLLMGAALALGAAARPSEPPWAWRAYALAAAAGATALVLALLETDLRLCAAAAAAAATVGGVAVHLRARLRWLQPARLLGAAALVLPVTAGVGYFVALPALHRADPRGAIAVLTALLGFWLAAVLSACGRRDADKLLGRRLWALSAGAVGCCALAAVNGPSAPEIAATVLAVGGWLLASAAVAERPAPSRRDLEPAHPTLRRAVLHVLLPTTELTAFAGLAAWALARDGVSAGRIAWFGGLFVAATVLGFTRQTVSHVALKTALVSERRARRSAQGRIDELLRSVSHDPETGFAGRAFFLETVATEVRRARRHDVSAGLVLFAVDQPDGTLADLAGTLDPILRAADVLGRLDDTTFALLLPETEQLDALIAAERVRAEISRGGAVTVSAGVGAFPADGASAEEVVDRTSGALAWARANGADLCAVVNRTTDRARAGA